MTSVAERDVGEGRERLFCSFWISHRYFGVDIAEVKEINPETHCTPIPHAPREIKGYVNVRGQLFLLIDMSMLLGFESKEADETSRTVLFHPEVGESFGILVDRIDDVRRVFENQIESHPESDQDISAGRESRPSDLVSGVCKLEDGLLVILNSRKILPLIGTLRAGVQGGGFGDND
jgi:chemotaxis signal transduction protein